MDEKLYASCNLCSIPFIGHTDTTRLQMAAKQLNQVVTHPNCEIPKVIGNSFRYLSDNATRYKLIAPTNGEVVYINDHIMTVLFKFEDQDKLLTYATPLVKSCSASYSSKLRYIRDIGDFKKGDLLYEYDSFKNNIPSYGYNLLTAYLPFFQFNHEDAIVISDTAAKTLCSTKSETILIPIYTNSLFKRIYKDSKYQFLPEIGQKINNNTVVYKSINKSQSNTQSLLQKVNLTDFASILNNELQFTSVPITSKITNGVIHDIRVQTVKRAPMIDIYLQKYIEIMYKDYCVNTEEVFKFFDSVFTREFALNIISQHYYLMSKIGKVKFNLKDLLYIIEVKIVGESKTEFGDKLTNRYANKGVVSLIIPDELRPIAMHTKKPVDMLVGPISVNKNSRF